MNSLAYISRQFDVLASAKTPPSTPTSERPAFIQVGSRRGDINPSPSQLQRVSTWSTKSLLSDSTMTSPKRSFSSPIFTSLRKKIGLMNPSSPASPSSVEAQPRSKTQVDSLLRRIFLIRVFVLAWDNLRAIWLSLWSREGRSLSLDDDIRHSQHITNNEMRLSQAPLASVSQAITEPIEFLSSQIEPQPLSPVHSIRASESPASISRSSTPLSGTRKTPFHQPKTLVLDLDETLIHSTSRPIHSHTSSGRGFFGLGSFDTRNKGTCHMVEVVLGGRSTLYHVYKRPFVDFFLRTVSSWYTLVIFTASMQEYADPVIDWLDAGRGILGHRLFRDSCTQLPNGSFTKDLSVVEADLSRVCLVDNSPVSYRVNEANGIPIEGWTHDPSDEALLDLLPVLDSLRFTSDVRRVLGLRTAGEHS